MRQIKTQPTSARRIVDALVPTPFPKPTRVRENDYDEYGEYGETPRREVIKKMRSMGVKGNIPGEYDAEDDAATRSMPDDPARQPHWPDYSDEYRGPEY